MVFEINKHTEKVFIIRNIYDFIQKIRKKTVINFSPVIN